MEELMTKKLHILTAITSVALIALTGCTSSSPNITPTESSVSFDTELSNSSLNNLDALASKAVNVLDDYDFRETMKTFLRTGKMQEGYTEQFKELSSLVSHDEVWEEEKLKVLQMIKNMRVLADEEDAGLYLDTAIVNFVFQPEALEKIESVPVYQFDVSAFNKLDENNEISWSKTGGLSISNVDKMVYAVLTPADVQYFADNGKLLSARNATQQLGNPLNKLEVEESLQSVRKQITHWISSTGLDEDPGHKTHKLDLDILNDISIPSALTKTGQSITTLDGTVNDYVLYLTDGDNHYSVTSKGETTIPVTIKEHPLAGLPQTNLKIAWDAYKKASSLLKNDSTQTNVEKIVESLKEESTTQNGIWGVEKVGGYYYVTYEQDGIKNIFSRT